MEIESARELRVNFLRDGVVHLPGVLDSETLRLAEAAFDFSLAHPGPVAAHVYDASGFQLAPGGPDPKRRVSAGAPLYVYQDLANPGSVDAYRELVTRPVIQEILRALFTEEDAEPPFALYVGEQVFVMEGDIPGRKSWHQDLTGPDARGDHLVTFWMSFGSVEEGEGVNLVRGSHRGPVYESLVGGYEGVPIPDVEGNPDAFDIVSFATKPGDLVVFHMATLHGTGPTVRERPRQTLAIRFMGPESHPGTPGRTGGDFSKAVYGMEAGEKRRRANVIKVL